MLGIEVKEAGMHLIGWLPDAIDDREAEHAARQHKLIARPLSAFNLKPVERGALVPGYTAFDERKYRR